MCDTYSIPLSDYRPYRTDNIDGLPVTIPMSLIDPEAVNLLALCIINHENTTGFDSNRMVVFPVANATVGRYDDLTDITISQDLPEELNSAYARLLTGMGVRLLHPASKQTDDTLPTDEEMRQCFDPSSSDRLDSLGQVDNTTRDAMFNQWLEHHDRLLMAHAWNEGHTAGQNDTPVANPYEEVPKER